MKFWFVFDRGYPDWGAIFIEADTEDSAIEKAAYEWKEEVQNLMAVKLSPEHVKNMKKDPRFRSMYG